MGGMPAAVLKEAGIGLSGRRCVVQGATSGGLRQVLVMGLTWWWSGRSLLLRREVARECGMLENGGSGRETLGMGK